MEVLKCDKCGAAVEEGNFCTSCGAKLGSKSTKKKIDEEVVQEKVLENDGVEVKENDGNLDINNVSEPNKSNSTNKTIIIIIAAVVGGLLIGFLLFKAGGLINDSNTAIKVDISMTSYYGHINYILDELGLDFDLVTMGANCYTGVQKNQFKTEKYGILYTEFRYCKVNYTTIFRVYNDERDQPLRDPKPGELAKFDSYGRRISSSTY